MKKGGRARRWIKEKETGLRGFGRVGMVGRPFS